MTATRLNKQMKFAYVTYTTGSLYEGGNYTVDISSVLPNDVGTLLAVVPIGFYPNSTYACVPIFNSAPTSTNVSFRPTRFMGSTAITQAYNLICLVVYI